jgi:hypothetical protein
MNITDDRPREYRRRRGQDSRWPPPRSSNESATRKIAEHYAALPSTITGASGSDRLRWATDHTAS